MPEFKAYLRDEPIIRSLMDIDFYKFTMGQLIFNKHANVPVRFVFKNRTKSVRLAEAIDLGELREQLQHCRTLRFDNSELHYLRGTNEYQERMFVEPYLDFLREFFLSDFDLSADSDGQIRLEFPGGWSRPTYWETIALSIANELYYRSQLRRMTRFERDRLFAEGIIRLHEKINMLRQFPEIKFTDFGTRRRFSFLWQNYVVETLKRELPNQIIGTSNTLLAMRHGLPPMGTSAHEPYMGLFGIMYCEDDQIVRSSHNRVLQEWWEQYGYGLSIALTDTYGSDFFFRDMTTEQAENWKGLRHDSGDPIEFGEKAIRFYRSHGIDSTKKLIVFSDGLDVQAIIDIHLRFKDRILTTFGWGTNLTNDLGLKSLSLIVKLLEAGGNSTIKLSDNTAKAMGPAEIVERGKRIFGHTNKESQECIY